MSLACSLSKGRFTRYDFVASNLLTTRLPHEKSSRILKHVLTLYDNRGLKSVGSVSEGGFMQQNRP